MSRFKLKKENSEENVDVSQGKLSDKKLEELRKDLLKILSDYRKLGEKKHKAYENYIKQLVDSGKKIDYGTAYDLMELGEDKLLISNLKHCRGLKLPIIKYLINRRHLDAVLDNMEVLNYGVIEKGEDEPHYSKIATFDLDESDYANFIFSMCIEKGKGSSIACHINDFIVYEEVYNKNSSLYNCTCTLDGEPMFDVEYIENIMWRLIKFDLVGDNSRWTIYLDRFQKHYHGLINPEIAFRLIDMGGRKIEDVAKNLSLFKPNKQLVYKIVELGYGEKINAESISGFEGDEYKEIVHYLVDRGVKL